MIILEMLDFKCRGNKIVKARIKAKNLDCALSFFKGRFDVEAELIHKHDHSIYHVKQID